MPALFTVFKYAGSSMRRSTRKIASNPTGRLMKKNPAPRVVVGNPAAKSRSECRRDNSRDAVDCESQPTFLGRERVRQNRLRHRLQPAASQALQHPKQEKERKGWSDSTEHGAQREEGHTRHEESLATEHAGDPAAGRQNNGVGYEIRSQYPRALVVADTKVACHVWQGHIGDARIEKLHECRHRHHTRDQPRIMAAAHRRYTLGTTFTPGRS